MIAQQLAARLKSLGYGVRIDFDTNSMQVTHARRVFTLDSDACDLIADVIERVQDQTQSAEQT